MKYLIVYAPDILIYDTKTLLIIHTSVNIKIFDPSIATGLETLLVLLSCVTIFIYWRPMLATQKCYYISTT